MCFHGNGYRERICILCVPASKSLSECFVRFNQIFCVHGVRSCIFICETGCSRQRKPCFPTKFNQFVKDKSINSKVEKPLMKLALSIEPTESATLHSHSLSKTKCLFSFPSTPCRRFYLNGKIHRVEIAEFFSFPFFFSLDSHHVRTGNMYCISKYKIISTSDESFCIGYSAKNNREQRD